MEKVKVFVYDPQPVRAMGFQMLLQDCPDLQFGGASSVLDPSVFEDEMIAVVVGKFNDRDLTSFSASIGGPERIVILGENMSQFRKLTMFQLGFRFFGDLVSSPKALTELLGAMARGEASSWDVTLRDVASSDRFDRLTSREWEVTQLVEQGRKNKEIALALEITTGTVKVHLMHVFEKVGCSDRIALALCLRAQNALAQGANGANDLAERQN